MKSKKKQRIYVIVNIVLPIMVGAVIYYLFSPNVIFVKLIDKIFGVNNHFMNVHLNGNMWRFVRNYFLDMLWSYALVFCLFGLSGNNTAKVGQILVASFAFATVVEMLQIMPWISGTYDTMDVVMQLLAEIVAVFIIKIIF